MKRRLVISAAFCLGLAGFAARAELGPDTFSADGRKWQPAPTGHVPGKDNGAGAGLHNAGEDCGICHRPGGKAASRVFTIAGTLYEDRGAGRLLPGGEVILQGIDGGVLSLTANAAGNFWTSAPLASNPAAVASHSGVTEPLYTDTSPAAPSDSRTWQYKAWVRNGGQVIPMVTIAPVGGSTDPQSRMSCSMHHSPLGTRGALWVSQKSALASYPASGLSFRRHILPIFRSKCVPCHIPGSTPTRLVTRSDLLTPSTSIDHSHGRDFTSFAGSTVGGVAKTGIGAEATPYVSTPDQSPLLVKTRIGAAGAVPTHAGGSYWTTENPDYRAIRQWIAEGAWDN